MDEMSAVTQVPMFWPIIMGMAIPKDISPVTDRAISMPTEADDD